MPDKKLDIGHIPLKPPKMLSTRRPLVSPAHKAVVDAWFANGCTSKRRALLECGYADTMASNPANVFGREDVQAEIERRWSLRGKRSEVTEQRIIDELAKLAFSNLGDLLEVEDDGTAWLDLTGLTADQKAALGEFHTEEVTRANEGGSTTVRKNKVKFHDKKGALETLARIKGMMTDKVEVTGSLGLVDRIAKARAVLASNRAKQE